MGPILTGLGKFSPKNRFTMGMLQSKNVRVSLIVVIAPWHL